ncbi:hypothetical protein PLICRDRAFT_176290 [Plicaturopsis crispa FD-325 SS-3]|nr:hypothetical protein PLICRDRAFT_176290 [Plicaturopsis crispa FD-325 SS-3]
MPPESPPDIPQKQQRRQREREEIPQPTDFAAKMIALQRKNAGVTRPKDRAERPLPPPPPAPRPQEKSPRKTPHVVVSRPTEADPEEFSRRLKISHSPRPKHATPQQAKLYNPEKDAIPMRHTAEPESISDVTSSSYARSRPDAQRQLFDHRKDDPVRFSVLARPNANGRPSPTPKSSGEYVSNSSTSSYAHSITSSNFTLSSNTTDGSSASSALFDRPQNASEDSGSGHFSQTLKRIYRGISSLEAKIISEHADEEAGDEVRTVLRKEVTDDQDKWKAVIHDHKKLAEMMHNLLELSLAPSVPASLRNIPTKYNIIIRLWTHAFHKLLEALRRASFNSPLALEHLQDFIYYAYTFYTGLLEEQTLKGFRSGWLEALGDLARYRMAVAAMVTGSGSGSGALTAAAVSSSSAAAAEMSEPPEVPKAPSAKSVSDAPAARIDDSPSPSVGIAAARLLDVEPEKERWRGIAREWYSAGLTDTPGTGKLHHHLGLLSREVEGEDLRAVYHFVKSMTCLHPFSTSRESVLPIWSPAAQARRTVPDASVPDLFVLLHGMLFTNIQLDDFQPTLARFLERLAIEGAEEREWIMMAVVNIGAVLEYGRAGGVLKKAGGVGGREGLVSAAGGNSPNMRLAKRGPPTEESEERKMDVDDNGAGEGDFVKLPRSDNFTKSPQLSRTAASAMQISPVLSEAPAASPDSVEQPPALKFALQLMFSMLSQVLRDPMRKASPFASSTLNPYSSVVLTFLATILKHSATRAVLERAVPWDALAVFFATAPRVILAEQDPQRWTMLTSGCSPPLPEDWCLRGMEWVGRRVFERGFWKSGDDRKMEMDVLDRGEADVSNMTDGIIEDDEDDGGAASSGTGKVNGKRWVRIVRSAVGISDAIDGFNWHKGRDWRVEGVLENKVRQWKEEERVEREEDERRRRGTRWAADDSMDVDEAEGEAEDASEESEDDENDGDAVKALRARRRYLLSLQKSGSSPPSRRSRPRTSKNEAVVRHSLNIIPGYTILVVDTNILLSSLAMFATVVESFQWTVIVPLPVIMELDGLSSNTTALGEAAQSAMSYITAHIRTHSKSLKVQTSKGNYLTTLSVRAEQIDFDDGSSWERSMDDLILKAAIWQDEHWVDRSALLQSNMAEKNTSSAVKVVLLSLDRNLRLKARSRQLPAANEKDLASILTPGR